MLDFFLNAFSVFIEMMWFLSFVSIPFFFKSWILVKAKAKLFGICLERSLRGEMKMSLLGVGRVASYTVQGFGMRLCNLS